ncbi:MAG: MFS transporter [Thermodesulfovibrionales bacterium]|jgi:PAT family beta-lactamase induction signal transducer AmpG
MAGIKASPYFQVFRSRRIGVITLLGFASGLPLSLTGSSLQAWMAVEGVDIKTIGIFVLVGLPYTLKFLWSPLMDRFVPPWLDRRRGWIILTQLCLAAGIALISFLDPAKATWLVGAIALTVAFASASQDIVIDAYRTDLLHEKERGMGAAVFVMGYRIAMLVSGALALILSDRIGWQNTYFLMAGVMALGIIATLWGPSPERDETPPKNLQEAVIGPLSDYFSRQSAWIMLFLIILYKLGDAYAGSLTTPFLIKGVGFSATDVGSINKGVGLVSLIVGGLIGGTIMIRLGLYWSLLVFGILQAISNLSFMALAMTGKSYAVLLFAVAFENITGGMGTAAFVALLMAMCNSRYSATQYALLSSLAALGRIFIGPTSGFVAASLGWAAFFFITAIASIPGLLLLWVLRKNVEGLKGCEG